MSNIINVRWSSEKKFLGGFRLYHKIKSIYEKLPYSLFAKKKYIYTIDNNPSSDATLVNIVFLFKHSKFFSLPTQTLKCEIFLF